MLDGWAGRTHQNAGPSNVIFFGKPLNEGAEGRFEAEVKGEELRNCSPMILLYCCDVSEARNLSAVRHGARRPYPRVKCHSTCGDRMSDRKSSSQVVMETIDKRGW